MLARAFNRRALLRASAAATAGVIAPVSATFQATAQETVELSVWSYLPPDDPSVKKYIKVFQSENEGVSVKYTAFPEDDYQTKVRTALSAGGPPDIAIIEDRSWMKGGFVVELTDKYVEWGVDPANFNPGGIARMAPEGKIEDGLFAAGDFLGGNTIFYNKRLFDEAGLEYPGVSESMTWTTYDQLARALGKPDRNPGRAIYGCSVQPWFFGIWSKWVWGDDGRTIGGNPNSPEMVEAWNIGTALVRDGFAPGQSLLQTMPAGESDLFAQGKIAMTWSDFTEVTKYQANDIDFGLTPFVVIGGIGVVRRYLDDPMGNVHKDSKHPDEALAFLRFISTDAQTIRTETPSDPPLSTSVAEEINWSEGDPIRGMYLDVLQQAKPQVFVPTSFLPEGTYDSEDVFRRMTIEGNTDAQPLLDEAAEKTQPELDKAWEEWEKLTPSS